MNPITKAIEEIKYSIPRDILEVALVKHGGWRNAPITIDDRILNKIIRPKVQFDCDMVGGIEMELYLSDITPSFTDRFETVFKIPKALTDDRSILSVLSLTVGATAATQMAPGYAGSASPLAVAWRAYDAAASGGIGHTVRCELIGENTVLVKEQAPIAISSTLRVLVENSHNLSNINIRSYRVFSELCILAAKAYIYNTLIIPLEQSQLYAGQELGIFKDVVTGYESAYEEYGVLLHEKWAKVAFMNDNETFDGFIKAMISPGL